MTTTTKTIKSLTIGTRCVFVYNGKVRDGIVEKMGTSDNGDWFTLELTGEIVGGFRCFTLAKCEEWLHPTEFRSPDHWSNTQDN